MTDRHAGHAAEFASTLRQARRLGSVTSYLPGAGKLSDPVQSANLQQYELIIGCAHLSLVCHACYSAHRLSNLPSQDYV